MPAKFSILAVSAMPIIPIALACGGDDGNTIKIPDAAVMVDAPVICTASASYPAPPTPGRAWDYKEGLFGSDSMGNPSPHEIDYVAALDTATPRDVLYVALFAGYGVFSTGDIAVGTYNIAGDDAKFSTCGACVLIAADVSSSGTIGDWYMATAGSIALTRVNIADTSGSDGSAHFVGTLSNVNFVHVAKSSQGGPGDAIQDNCVSSLPSASMDAKLAVGSAGIAGNGESARTIENIPVRFITGRRF